MQLIENPYKLIDIVEEILNFNEQQKGKRTSLGLGYVSQNIKSQTNASKITNSSCTGTGR